MDCAVYHNQFSLLSLDLALLITDQRTRGDIWHRSQMTETAHCFRPIYNRLKVKKPPCYMDFDGVHPDGRPATAGRSDRDGHNRMRLHTAQSGDAPDRSAAGSPHQQTASDL